MQGDARRFVAERKATGAGTTWVALDRPVVSAEYVVKQAQAVDLSLIIGNYEACRGGQRELEVYYGMIC